MSGILYRPGTYEDVIGATSTVTILKTLVLKDKVPQAVAFTGNFGSGKTTLARIFAKSILCKEPINGGCCNTCSACEMFNDGGLHPNYTEVDATTIGGKAGVMELIDKLKYSNIDGNRMIIVIDEAHSLSSDAKDVLLKVLEEEGVDGAFSIFLLTNQRSKMNGPIMSRVCEMIVPTPTRAQIMAKLKQICEKSNLEYTDSALANLATVYSDNFRASENTLGVLEALGGATDENLEIVAPATIGVVIDMIYSAVSNDISAAINSFDTLISKAPADLIQSLIIKALMDVVRYNIGLDIPAGTYREIVSKLSTKLGDSAYSVMEQFLSPALKEPVLLQSSLISLHQKAIFGKIEAKVANIRKEEVNGELTEKPVLEAAPGSGIMPAAMDSWGYTIGDPLGGALNKEVEQEVPGGPVHVDSLRRS